MGKLKRTVSKVDETQSQQSMVSKRSKRSYVSPYSLPLTGFGNKKTVRLRYCEEISLSPTAGAIASWTFSANGMYDPNVTGSGHQPSGFDQNMAFYDQYTVVKSRCKVRYIDNAGGNKTPGYLDVLLTDNGSVASGFANVEAFLESRFAHGDRMMSAGTERNYIGLDTWRTVHFDAKKFFSLKNPVGDKNITGSAGANPDEGAFFEVVCGSITGVAAGSLKFLVCIDYIAVLTEPKNIIQS